MIEAHHKLTILQQLHNPYLPLQVLPDLGVLFEVTLAYSLHCHLLLPILEERTWPQQQGPTTGEVWSSLTIITPHTQRSFSTNQSMFSYISTCHWFAEKPINVSSPDPLYDRPISFMHGRRDSDSARSTNTLELSHSSTPGRLLRMSLFQCECRDAKRSPHSEPGRSSTGAGRLAATAVCETSLLTKFIVYTNKVRAKFGLPPSMRLMI